MDIENTMPDNMDEKKNTEQKHAVSYTQFNMWRECPFRWKLNYIDKLGVKSENINTIFGRSMHEVLQEYLTVMYKQTIPAADSLDLQKLLFEKMSENFIESRKNGVVMLVTKEEMVSYFEDGCDILDWFVKNKGDYFGKRGYELVGVEMPINWPVKDGVHMVGYLDVVIRDTVLNRIKIYDFKTSRQGWNKYQKTDRYKLMQLVLYKAYYAKQYGHSVDQIDVEFLILKRKLFEKSDYPQKRIQKVSPASGSITVNAVLTELDTFISMCFDSDGNRKTGFKYEKRPSQKACRYCEFSPHPDICDKNKTKPNRVKTEKMDDAI
jgi:hypothetical protein